MPSLKSNQIITSLLKGKTFSAKEKNGSYDITFDPQFPYLCVAIHNGHRLEKDLEPYCYLKDKNRIFEEDPHTGDLINGYPNRIICHDSRYEYDLNRNEDECIYDTAWEQKIWAPDTPSNLIERSRQKHRDFYSVFDAAVQVLIKKHGFCAVYDIHSYNGERRGGTEAPAFNMGTAQIDLRQHRSSINYMQRQLDAIVVTGDNIRAAENEVFSGMGYLATRTRELSNKALCLPIEIKKFFCNEKSGKLYPQTFNELKDELTHAISNHAAFFINKHTEKKKVQPHHMLSSDIEPITLELDQNLFKIVKSLETLLYINPINIEHERKKFFSKKERYNPTLKYRKLDIDPFLIKEKLFRLPVEEISDVTLQSLYRQAINGLSTEVDLISVIGTKECLYNSLRYYGEPDRADIENARFLLHAPKQEMDLIKEETINDHEIATLLQKEIDHYKLDAPVKLSSRLVAGAMVDNTNYRVLIKKDNQMTYKAAQALKHHEIGVHLLTSSNARNQPLHLFRLGLPGSTETQEGLAVLAEYLSGNLSLNRLKTLALRVMAVRYLLEGHSFSRTYDMLIENFDVTENSAFTTTLRVFRGGGFTKDYLYLRGLAKAYAHWKAERSWEPLLIGKTSFDDFDRIQELINRKVILKPTCLPDAFTKQKKTAFVHDYLLSSLKYKDEDNI